MSCLATGVPVQGLTRGLCPPENSKDSYPLQSPALQLPKPQSLSLRQGPSPAHATSAAQSQLSPQTRGHRHESKHTTKTAGSLIMPALQQRAFHPQAWARSYAERAFQR